MKWKQKRMSMMFQWMLSYLLVFMISMTAVLGLYFSVERTIREDINAVSDYVLAQIQLSFDNITSEVYALTRQIALDNEINDLMNQTSFSTQNRLLIMDAVSKCATYKANAPFVDDFYIYLKNSGSVLKYSGFVESDALEGVIPQNGKYDRTIWDLITEGQKSNQIIPYAYKSSESTLKESVAYIIPVPLYATEPQGFVVAHIDKRRYKEIAIQIYPTSDFVVMDRHDNLIFSTTDAEREEALLSELKNVADGKMKLDGTEYQVKETYSGVNSLRYISITAQNAAYEKLSYIRRIMVVMTLSYVLLGILCAIYFSRKNYRPIKEVSSLLAKQKLLKNDDNYEESKLLIDAIDQLIRGRNETNQKLYRQRDYVCMSIISRLINNGFSDGITPEKLYGLCDLDFSGNRFAVLVFHIYEQEGAHNDVKEYELRYLIVKNVFEELLNQHYTAYITEVNSTICGIVNFEAEDEAEYSKTLKIVADRGKSVIFNNFGMELAIASGMVYRDINSIPQGYGEAVAGIQYLVFRQSKDLLFYDGLVENIQSGYEYYFSFNREQNLINCIKSGDAVGAKRIINDIFEKYNEDSIHSLSVIQCLISDVAAAVFKAACQVPGNAVPGMPAEFFNSQNLDAVSIKAKFFAFIDKVCLGVAASISENENAIVQKIKELIAMEYNNINLNISYIADKIGFNATYISRVFLNNAGDGLLNYINKYRVEKAKALLENPDLGVESVGAMVGFGSSNTFIRVFKKYEYITPGQFRQQLNAEMKKSMNSQK